MRAARSTHASSWSGISPRSTSTSSTATRNLLAVDADLKRGVPSPAPIRELYRSLHTIKGLSAMVGFDPLVDLAHAMENVLREADQVGGSVDDAGFELLMKGLSAIEQRVRAVGRKEPVARGARAIVARSVGGQGARAAAADRGPVELPLPPEIAGKLSASERNQILGGHPGWSARGTPGRGADPGPHGGRAHHRRRTRAGGPLGEVVKVVPLARPVTQAEPGGLLFALLLLTDASEAEVAAAVQCDRQAVSSFARPAGAPPPTTPSPGPLEPRRHRRGTGRRRHSSAPGVVRVEVSRLDDALDKLSALVVTRFRLERAVAEMAAQGVDVRGLRAILGEHGRQIRDLRAAIMKARMVSAAELFERIPLLVRRLGVETDKRVLLELDTARGELDKGVGERIFPAIVHLIRNAVDHGLERPDERRRAGKPEQGRIRVSCHERGQQPARDNGGGRRTGARRACPGPPRRPAGPPDARRAAGAGDHPGALYPPGGQHHQRAWSRDGHREEAGGRRARRDHRGTQRAGAGDDLRAGHSPDHHDRRRFQLPGRRAPVRRPGGGGGGDRGGRSRPS